MSETKDMNLDDLATEPAVEDADLDLDALKEETPTEGDADIAEAAEESAEEEKYEKNNNFNNSDDYLRKFSESFSTAFVLSPDLIQDEISRLPGYKADQDINKAKAAKALEAVLDNVKKQMHSN